MGAFGAVTLKGLSNRGSQKVLKKRQLALGSMAAGACPQGGCGGRFINHRTPVTGIARIDSDQNIIYVLIVFARLVL